MTVESFAQWGGGFRARVLAGPAKAVQYVTWPYRDEAAACARARRWIREQARSANKELELFSTPGTGNQ